MPHTFYPPARTTQPVDTSVRDRRFAMALTTAAGVALATSLFAATAGSAPVATAGAALSAVLLVALAIGAARLTGAVTREQHATQAERVLRDACARLAGVRDPDEVRAMLFEGIDVITHPAATATVVIQGNVITASNVDGLQGKQVDLGSPVVEALLGTSEIQQLTEAEARVAGRAVGLPQDAEAFVVAPLDAGRHHAVLALSADRLLPAGTMASLRTLAGLSATALSNLSCSDDLHVSASRFASVVNASYDVIAVATLDGRLTYVSPSVAAMLGRDHAELVGQPLDGLARPEDAERVRAFLALAAEDGGASTGRIRLAHSDGSWRYCEARGKRLDPSCGPHCAVHSDLVEIVLNIRDVTDRVSLEDDLARRAFHDALTDLPNRALLTNRVEQALRVSRRTGRMVGVLFWDLDDFKAVNDTLGHQVGDQLLIEVGRRMLECIRPSDTGARMGGDEFAIVLEDLDDADEAAAVARRLLARLETPFTFGISEIAIGASIGIAVGTADDTAGELLRRADIAMYMAKRRGKNRLEVFREDDPSQDAETLKSLAELQRALERGEFVAHYQPTIDLDEGRILGVEALVRWQHPERGLLPPDEFIPLAEESGLIVAIGSWVLREACEQIGRWQLELGDLAPREISVNLSAAQLARDDFVLEVADALDDTAMSSGALTLEITESGLMSDLALTSRRLGALKRLGVNLAVDDFGTGYSSLAYLQQFPIDTLKIDRAFVAHVDGSAENAALAKAIVRLGHDLNLRTVAEGIERPSQVEALRRIRCPVGQGFYFSQPLRAEEISALLRDGHVPPPPEVQR